MKQLYPQPYKLYNKIRRYDWGTKNNEAFIPKFLGIDPEPNVSYAELWIGAHPKASSEIEIEEERFPLNEIIQKFPNDCLGKYVSQKFSGKFPFLLKVLSAGNALSIQTHPNKAQAVKLHSVDPKNYPDDNHKPEIAIAIDSLIAIAGFRPVNEIMKNLRELPELNDFAGIETIKKIFHAKNIDDAEKCIRELYSKIMKMAEDKENLSSTIKKIKKRLSGKNSLSIEETQFLRQYDLFGADVGLFSFFFFNIIQLKPGEAIFTDAGIPHAYIKGNIIECMANSDNVVRAGLTNKFKDVKTLLEIIRYNFAAYEIINFGISQDEFVYRTKADEFEVASYRENIEFKKIIRTNDKPEIYLVLDGKLKVSWKLNGKTNSLIFLKGESFFIPAFLPEYEIASAGEVKFYQVTIP
ncbi:MAG: mannose-6-phosphate isomerase, class I [Ignavibacteriaceae bacterium]